MKDWGMKKSEMARALYISEGNVYTIMNNCLGVRKLFII